MDWFLHDRELRHERVKKEILRNFSEQLGKAASDHSY